MNKPRDVNDLSQKSHPSDRRYRNNALQEQENLTATRNSPNSDGDDDFLEIDELLSGIRQESMPASADLNDGDDDDDGDGSINIDELLSSIQQKSVLASAGPNSGGMAEMVDNGTRGSSPTDSSHSTGGSSRDLIILSDDESAGAESETNYSDLDVDVRAKSDSDPQHITDSELADGDGFGSGATLIPDRPITDHQDDSNHNNGVVDHTKPQLTADHLKSASPSQSFPTHQASKLQVNTDNTQGTMSSVNVNFDVTNS